MDQGPFNEVAKKALEIRRTYYELMDDPNRRMQLADMYPGDVPDLCEWNGHPLPTQDAIRSYLSTLPKTQHHIDCVDAQPLPGNENADSILMIVNGTVTYDDEHKREFFQRLVVRRGPNNKYYIINDYYRWVAER